MPKSFDCPISLEKMILPVITNTGHSYDFLSLAEYFLTTKKLTNPQDRQPITALIINYSLRDSQPLTELEWLKIAFLLLALKKQWPTLVLTTIITLPNVNFYINKINSNQLISYLSQTNQGSLFIELMQNNVFLQLFIMSHSKLSLCQAALGADLDLIQFLVDYGVNLNQKNKQNETPLFIAAKYGHAPVVDYLVSHVAVDVNTVDATGYTPYTIATYCGHLDCMKSLKKRDDLNHNYVTVSGVTPVWLAVFNGRRDVLAYLLADPSVLCTQPTLLGTTPYKLAVKQQRHEFADMIRYAFFSSTRPRTSLGPISSLSPKLS
ncbi:MAG: hypothetical protein CK424_06185 [Legionella sp.]|nr:MAG: hypothetical protein CK424_06185 [Legionella sp.]